MRQGVSPPAGGEQGSALRGGFLFHVEKEPKDAGGRRRGELRSPCRLTPRPPFYGGSQLGSLGSHRKGAGGSADTLPLVFRCRWLGGNRELGTPLVKSAFVAVGLKLCGGKRRAGEDTRPYGGYRNSCIFCRARYPHRTVPGRPSVPPLRKETSRIFLRGRTLAGPPMTKDFRYTAGGAIPYPLWPFGPSPIDKGSRPLPYGFRENLPFLRRGAPWGSRRQQTEYR